ncbi:MAG: pimeloyl-ACP methyl ester carboxylesterase [Oleispira sp.]|jgi:pimeloyl-ACP methyl ester carboxylesterase
MNLGMIRIFIFTSAMLAMSASYAEDVFFKHGTLSLSGHYLEPTNGKPAKAVLLFVHGDGPMAFDAEGYYSILWRPLRDKGFAIFSWDKPGVGGSHGNWLDQSMEDRQLEVLAAIDFVQNKYDFSHKKTGLIGFSQAGWVMPALAGSQSKIGFMIGVGFARSWGRQGEYHTRVRYELEGKDQHEIDLALTSNYKEVEFLKSHHTFNEYEYFAGKDAMSMSRYEFVLKNFMSDATVDYSNINIPSFFIWGEMDKNVNATDEFNWWQSHGNEQVRTRLIKNANHGMLDAELFGGQEFGFSHWLKLMWLGQDAFALDFFPAVEVWLEELDL